MHNISVALQKGGHPQHEQIFAAWQAKMERELGAELARRKRDDPTWESDFMLKFIDHFIDKQCNPLEFIREVITELERDSQESLHMSTEDFLEHMENQMASVEAMASDVGMADKIYSWNLLEPDGPSKAEFIRARFNPALRKKLGEVQEERTFREEGKAGMRAEYDSVTQLHGEARRLARQGGKMAYEQEKPPAEVGGARGSGAQRWRNRAALNTFEERESDSEAEETSNVIHVLQQQIKELQMTQQRQDGGRQPAASAARGSFDPQLRCYNLMPHSGSHWRSK